MIQGQEQESEIHEHTYQDEHGNYATDASGNLISHEHDHVITQTEIGDMNPNNNLQDNSESVTITNIPLNRWFHLAVVGKDNLMQVYVNGELSKTHVSENHIHMNDGDIYVNKFGGYIGEITQLRYYGEYMTNKEVTELYNKGPSPFVLPRIKITAETNIGSEDWLNSS